jgi:hypothetical protein
MKSLIVFFCITLLAGCITVASSVGKVIPAPTTSPVGNVMTIAEQSIPSGLYGVNAGFYDEETNKTFVTWMGERSHPYIQFYDHATSTWSEARQVGTNPSADWHNYPVLLQAADSRLLIFHPQHYENAPLKLARSPQPSDITGTLADWGDREIAEAPAAAYPKAVKLANGDIYVFYRETSFVVYPNKGLYPDDRPLQYIWSEDNGETWQSSKSVAGDIAVGSWGLKDNFNEIYLGQVRLEASSGSRPERLHLVWTRSGGGPKGPNNHAAYLKDVYYAYFQPSNKHFYSVTGEDLGTNIDVPEMVAKARVEDTGIPGSSGYENRAVSFLQLVHYDDQGRPILAYALSNQDGTNLLRTQRWTNSAWQSTDIRSGFDERVWTGGTPLAIERKGASSFTLYLTTSDIYTYTTHDAGATWQACEVLYHPQGSGGFGRLAMIENYKQPVQLLLFEYAPNASANRQTEVYTAMIEGCNP